MTSLVYDVVILPDDRLLDKVTATGKKLSSLGSLFTLDGANFYPHISLFMLRIKPEDLAKAAELLSEITQTTDVVNLQASRFDQNKGYIDVEYHCTEQLHNLQQQAVAALAPIRDGLREGEGASLLESTGVALENLQKYGYKYVGELFRPHVTFTRFDTEQSGVKTLLQEVPTFDGSFVKIGLFEMGENGTCIKKIKEFSL